MKAPLAILLITLACYAFTAGGHLYSPDEELMFRTAEAIATRGSLAIDPIREPDGGTFASRPASPPREDGREYAQYGIGQPLLAVPLVWVGRALASRGDDATWDRLSGGRYAGLDAATIAPRWAVSWFNILLAPWVAVLVFLLAHELGARRQGAFLAALLYALGTMAWPHSRPFFSETCAALFILLAWWATLRALRGPMLRWLALAGAAAGYAALVRMDSVFAYIGLAPVLLGPVVAAARSRGVAVRRAATAFCLPALACGAVLLALNWHHYGHPLALGYSDQPEGVAFSSPLLPGLYGLLFSVGKGLFFFSPVLALAFPGWPALRQTVARRFRTCSPLAPACILGGLALAVLVPLAMHAMWPNWAGGWCWGPRHIFLIHPFLALPIAAWISRSWSRVTRIVTAVFFVVGVTVQLMGTSQDFFVFHQRFFRVPPSPSTGAYPFHVPYDPFDAGYWGEWFQLVWSGEDGATPRPVGLNAAPAPISSSIFYPQHSVWAGYPILLREGYLDWFWVGLLRSDGEAAP